MGSRARTVALVVAATLAACGGAGDDDKADRPSPTVATSVPASPTSDVDPALADVVDAAVADLSDHLGVPADQITVASAQAVTWGDTSLGCPQPGQRYAQVVTEGVRVELVHDGTTHTYHAGDRAGLVRCEDPQQPVDPATS